MISRYLGYLPASFQADPFLGRFLVAFEQLLTGLGDGTSLEEQYDVVYRRFDPTQPDAFLPWLATWVATSVRDDWTDDLRRRFISRSASLYRSRGTKGYLFELLNIYLNDNKTLVIDDSGPTPHHFTVSFAVSADPNSLAQISTLARAVIDQEKPAHTTYSLLISFPSMQIIDHPTNPNQGLVLGHNTLLGTTTYTPGGS